MSVPMEDSQEEGGLRFISPSSHSSPIADTVDSSVVPLTYTLPTIACCECGTRIEYNASGMCVNCLKSRIDITEGIPKQYTIFLCRNCGRYQRPPWVHLELESRDMLAFCLKKMKGLDAVKLVDNPPPVFIWTEPHSRRIKVKLTIQKEVFHGAIVQQTFQVEYIISYQQCQDCQKSFTDHTWAAVVQVRQKVSHKKTMLMLEQLLLKHNVVNRAMGVKEHGDGLDFYWPHRSGARHLMDFLRSVVPIQYKESKRLISQDDNSNTYNYKYTLYAEIAPVCKDDLVLLDSKFVASLGASSPLFLVTRVTCNITLLDPITLRMCEVSGGTYWHHPFRAIMTAKQLIEYVVLDSEIVEEDIINEKNKKRKGNHQQQHQKNKSSITSAHPNNNLTLTHRSFSKQSIPQAQKLSLVSFTLAKLSEFGLIDRTYTCISHLGHVIHVGDNIWGYDLTSSAVNELIEEQDELSGKTRRRSPLPDVICVKKSYSAVKNRAKKRKFVIKTLVKEDAQIIAKHSHQQQRGDMRRNDIDMEEFLQEIEEDKELQGKVNLYKRKEKVRGSDRSNIAQSSTSTPYDESRDDDEEEDDDDGEDDVPEIDLNSLLEEMGSLQVAVGEENGASEGGGEMSESEGEGEYESGWLIPGTAENKQMPSQEHQQGQTEQQLKPASGSGSKELYEGKAPRVSLSLAGSIRSGSSSSGLGRKRPDSRR